MDRRTTSSTLPSSRKSKRQQMNASKSASFSQEMLREWEEKKVEDGDRIRQLETEVNRVKESEKNMLESLMSQTKQLEETKIELEEAKLEIRSLQEIVRYTGNPMKAEGLDLREKKNSDDTILAQEEITRLKNELRSATGAEEKSKKAMDDLAAALKEVASEANQAKEKLLVTQTELIETRAEVESKKYSLKNTEEKLRKAMDDVRRLKRDAEESSTAWNTKQEGFRDCMRLFEEEITKGKKENDSLIEAQRLAKDEISKMRDIMKQALNEANVVKEALEIARNENSDLQDAIAEKDRALERIGGGLEHEIDQKPSESAATILNPDTDGKSLPPPSSEVSTGEESRRRQQSWDEIQAENRRQLPSEVSRVENFSHNVGSSSLRFPTRHHDIPRQHKGRSLSSISGPIGVDEDSRTSNVSSDYFDSSSSRDPSRGGQSSPARKKKKPAVFKKFTELIRRKSFSVK